MGPYHIKPPVALHLRKPSTGYVQGYATASTMGYAGATSMGTVTGFPYTNPYPTLEAKLREFRALRLDLANVQTSGELTDRIFTDSTFHQRICYPVVQEETALTETRYWSKPPILGPDVNELNYIENNMFATLLILLGYFEDMELKNKTVSKIIDKKVGEALQNI